MSSEKVTPGQYLILTFDFSAVNRSPDVKTAEDSLNAMINSAIGNFYRIYAQHLGEATSEQLIAKNIDPSGAVGSLSGCVNLVTETLGAVREMDDPLYGVKGVSANTVLFFLYLILTTTVTYATVCSFVDLSLGG